jgi:2',3'-cyclic-nucleotide 2'-phosphodiesterase (5'-nucleotidase family)
MFPFTNYLVTFDILGSELLEMLKIVQAGPLGFYHTSGLRLTVAANGGVNHRLINATMYDGSPIIRDRMYRGMSIDFLLQGGDDFKDVMGKTYTLRNPKTHGTIRDLLRPKLIDIGVIKAGSLIDPDHPRLIVVPA